MKRNVVFKAILGFWFALLSGVIVFLLCEACERGRLKLVELRNPHVIKKREMTKASPEERGEKPIWEYGWLSYRPNASVASGSNSARVVFSTNNRGIRGKETVIPKPPGIFRIACIGGSTTVEGNYDATTYPALLEKILRDRFETDRIEVINCGVSGVNSLTQLKKIDAYLAEDPDLVVEYYGVNDICWGLLPHWVESQSKFQRIASRSRFLVNHFSHLFEPSPERIRTDLWQFSVGRLDSIYQTFNSRDIDFVLCTFAYPELALCDRAERDYFHHNFQTGWGPEARSFTFETYCRIVAIHNDNLRRYVHRRDIYVIPVREELRGGYEVFHDICHAFQAGIDLKAEIIANHLEVYLRKKWQLEAGQPFDARTSQPR